jgi:hypothetical protein
MSTATSGALHNGAFLHNGEKGCTSIITSRFGLTKYSFLYLSSAIPLISASFATEITYKSFARESSIGHTGDGRPKGLVISDNPNTIRLN